MMTTMSLGAGEIHLWLVDYEQVDAGLFDSYRALLSEQERQQEPRFYFARDRRRYLVTRALVRTVLSRYLPVSPQNWSFTDDRYGRPHIDNPEGSGVTFNIAHTHSLIVLGLSRDRALGIDVENVADREVSMDLAQRFFAADEAAALGCIPVAGQQFRFFEYWTFKESYIKARGMGLSLPLDKFSFRYPDDRAVEIAIDSSLGDNPDRWRFWQCAPSAQYLLAICAERGTTPASVIAMSAVPLHQETSVPLKFLRMSQ